MLTQPTPWLGGCFSDAAVCVSPVLFLVIPVNSPSYTRVEVELFLPSVGLLFMSSQDNRYPNNRDRQWAVEMVCPSREGQRAVEVEKLRNATTQLTIGIGRKAGVFVRARGGLLFQVSKSLEAPQNYTGCFDCSWWHTRIRCQVPRHYTRWLQDMKN